MARVQHGQGDWLTYHITTRTIGQAFYLSSPREKRRILSALDFYRRRKRFKLYGFVVMDNHVHFVIQPLEEHSLSDIMRDFKTWTSRNNTLKPSGQPLWERRYDDNRVESVEELRNVLKYLHNNPVRAGTVTAAKDFAFSSIHNYLENGREVIEIDMDWWEY